ncbi:C40 family peptidase [Gaetbulibacter aestuarii]|uniref:C40 family peptidase n=1 Tax=Gaetbulibacter aestuarii TaxID=1502358 RepID=A0ABW7N233_9FLAO
MKYLLIPLILILSLSSCKSRKVRRQQKETTENIIIGKKDPDLKNVAEVETKKPRTTRERIITYAEQFLGTPYQWGGTTKRGMDCSGLVFESFRSEDIFLPRISRDMAKKGKKIVLKQVITGDLLFFKTGNRRHSVNHVGLVVDIRDNDIKFIHATTHQGVIISGLNETYWLNAFYQARRIL